MANRTKKTKPPEVHVKAQSHLVTIWPVDHLCEDSMIFCLVVKDRGDGRWGIYAGQVEQQGGPLECLSESGRWGQDEARPDQRFTEQEALRLATLYAPVVGLGWQTAAEVLAEHEKNGCRG
jgi:hypothetical protein